MRFANGVILLSMLLCAASVPAQETGERRGPPPGVSRGDYAGPRPPADASDEEKRAFWRARAAERRQAEAAAPVAAAAAVPAADKSPPATAARPGKPAASEVPAARAQAVDPHAGHMMATAAPPVASSPPAAAASGRPRGMRGGDGVLWLSDQAPRRDGGGRPGGARGGNPMAAMGGAGGMDDMGMGGAPGRIPNKRLWLRSGSNPQTAGSVPASEPVLLLDAQQQASSIDVEAHGGPYNVTFPMPEPGVYNAYFVRRAVDRETLAVTVAKAEVMRSAGHAKVEGEDQLMVPRTDARVPVEIVRERKEKEGLFTRINYGDVLAFQVLRDGKPVQNARVTFTSGQGWSNSVQSDEDGRASFVVIRDYFPEWREFDRRHRETFVVSASFPVDQAGEWQGTPYRDVRYTTTLAGAYYPAIEDYESYAWGLGIAVVALLFSGTAIYLYRRRRVRPYREVSFDE